MPWPLARQSSITSKRFAVSLTVHSLTGLQAPSKEEDTVVFVDVKWKGLKGALGSRFRKSQKKGRTTPKGLTVRDGSVAWDQHFEHECALAAAKGSFDGSLLQPWDVHLVIRKAPAVDAEKALVVGKAALDLSEFGGSEELGPVRRQLPVTVLAPGLFEVSDNPMVEVSLNMLEVREDSEASGDDLITSHGTLAVKSKGKRVEQPKSPKAVVDLVLKTDYESPASSGSVEQAPELSLDSQRGESILAELREPALHYGTLAAVNVAVANALPAPLSSLGETTVDSIGDLFRKRESFALPATLVLSEADPREETMTSQVKVGMGMWRKRKMTFRSPTAPEDEPLLDKSSPMGELEEEPELRYVDSSSKEHVPWLSPKGSTGEVSEEGDVGPSAGEETDDEPGQWLDKSLASRDGVSTATAKVFFASFDQRSENAGGESACTALVAVVADWIIRSRELPDREEFDELIRAGSKEWRGLCEVEAYKARFPDKHFDLDTVLEASIRPLRVVPGKSFVGFFRPQGVGSLEDFFEGAMSFDSIWDEIAKAGPAEYIVSWNDHFFICQIREDRCCILDTLGERLHEGCKKAFVLQFDGDCECASHAEVLAKLAQEEEDKAASKREVLKSGAVKPKKEKKPKTHSRKRSFSFRKSKAEKISDEGSKSTPAADSADKANGSADSAEHKQLEGLEEHTDSAPEEVEEPKTPSPEPDPHNSHFQEPCGKKGGLCQCKYFVKNFLAAVPLEQLAADLKAGTVGEHALHRRLQIEFHYTEAQPFPGDE